MPCDTQILLCSRLVQLAYALPDAPDFAIPTALAGFGLELECVIQGVDPTRGPTPMGFIASGSAGTFCALRGTDNAIEGFEDAEFRQSPCPLVDETAPAIYTGKPGPQWEDGFGQVFNSLTSGDHPLPDLLATFDTSQVIFTGHSLGAPLALFAALSHGAKAVHLFESPRPGNAALAAAVAACNWFPASTSWVIDEDWVPDWPKGLWPLVPPYDPCIPHRVLASASVTPAIGAGLLLPIQREKAMHALTSVATLLAALP